MGALMWGSSIARLGTILSYLQYEFYCFEIALNSVFFKRMHSLCKFQCEVVSCGNAPPSSSSILKFLQLDSEESSKNIVQRFGRRLSQ